MSLRAWTIENFNRKQGINIETAVFGRAFFCFVFFTIKENEGGFGYAIPIAKKYLYILRLIHFPLEEPHLLFVYQDLYDQLK